MDKTKEGQIHNEGENSNVKNTQNDIVQSHDVVNFVTKPSPDDEGHTDSKYIDATQLEEHVPESQIPEAHKA